MVNPNNFVFVHDMVGACNKVLRFTKRYDDYEKFVKSEKTISAVLRELAVIGEAARNTSDNFRSKYSQVPWNQIFGMRNRLIHEYMGVQLPIVWQTVQEDIPTLKSILTQTIELDDTSAAST